MHILCTLFPHRRLPAARRGRLTALITSRQTRLFKTPDLATFHRTIATCLGDEAPWARRDTVVLVASRAARQQLRWTLEEGLADTGAAIVLPRMLTRDEFHGELHRRLHSPPRLLSPIERLVCGRAASETALAEGMEPPFKLRPGLVSEFLAFYDELRRRDRGVEAFERLLVGELDPSTEYDRGARRMLRQTRFLAAMFRAYEDRLSTSGYVDEHRLRALALEHGLHRPLVHVVVTLPDRASGSEGLWPADFDLLARLPGLARVDLVVTTPFLDAGLRDRLAELWPGVDETPVASVRSRGPQLVTPPTETGHRHWVWRDREEELLAVVRQVKARDPDERTAVVFQRPLPYLYLAAQLFASAGVPFETDDTLPLAAEPFAAAVDLALAFVASGYARQPAIDLLRSPHFRFVHDGHPLEARSIDALDRALLEARYLGDADRLVDLAERWCESGSRRESKAAEAALVVRQLADALAPLTKTAPASALLDCLYRFLEDYRSPVVEGADPEARDARARAAVVGVVRDLRDAHAEHDDPLADLPWLTSTLRRLVEGATFDAARGGGGVVLVDARAARYGSFDTVILVGLVDGEWPERIRQSSLYPGSLLGQLGWSRELDRLRAARAAFGDLLGLASSRTLVSTVAFEDDAVVAGSALLEDLDEGDFDLAPELASTTRVTTDAGLAEVPDRVPLGGAPSEWLALRLARGQTIDERRRGSVGPRRPQTYGVSSVERYLSCPFKYFASSVLRLGEEPADELVMTPRTRGRLVHEVFRAFFERWDRSGEGAIDADRLGRARAIAREVAEEHLATLPGRDQAVERAWLLGSPAGTGVVDRLLTLEVDRPGEVRERLLEHRFEGAFELTGDDGPRTVRLRGVADRIDLLEGDLLRVIDYKTGQAPDRAQSVQLSVYGRCAEQQLERRSGTWWRVADAGYVAFGDPRAWVPLDTRRDIGEALAEGQVRFLDAVDAIERGEFPPRPAEPFRCQYCDYPTVCRKDYVGDE